MFTEIEFCSGEKWWRTVSLSQSCAVLSLDHVFLPPRTLPSSAPSNILPVDTNSWPGKLSMRAINVALETHSTCCISQRLYLSPYHFNAMWQHAHLYASYVLFATSSAYAHIYFSAPFLIALSVTLSCSLTRMPMIKVTTFILLVGRAQCQTIYITLNHATLPAQSVL